MAASNQQSPEHRKPVHFNHKRGWGGGGGGSCALWAVNHFKMCLKWEKIKKWSVWTDLSLCPRPTLVWFLWWWRSTPSRRKRPPRWRAHFPDCPGVWQGVSGHWEQCQFFNWGTVNSVCQDLCPPGPLTLTLYLQSELDNNEKCCWLDSLPKEQAQYGEAAAGREAVCGGDWRDVCSPVFPELLRTAPSTSVHAETLFF